MREPFMAKVYHMGEVLPVILLFHCKALLVKRDCWSYCPPLIQSWPIQEKIWEALWKLEIVISRLSPTGYRGTEWYCLLGCHPRGGYQRETVYESTWNRWPFMYLGGHLQWEDECKVYGYPCSFSSALGKHLFYQWTIVLVIHKVMLCLTSMYCNHSHYEPPWANFRAWLIHQPPDIISECWVVVDIPVSVCMFANMQEEIGKQSTALLYFQYQECTWMLNF